MSESGPSGGIAPDPASRLQALRERGADSVDRVRFRYMEALAARAADRPGRAGQLLAGKLQALLADYERRLQQAGQETCQAEAPRQRPLAGLLAHIGRTAVLNPGPGAEQGIDAASSDAAGRMRKPAGELKSAAYFRDTWLSISVNQQVTQALAQAPENAGPLNSHILVLQSLELMREIAPEYLKRFMAHSEALLWLEQAESAGQKSMQKTVQKPAPRADKGTKRKAARGGTGGQA